MLVPLVGGGFDRILVADSNRLQFHPLTLEPLAGFLSGFQGDSRRFALGPAANLLDGGGGNEEDEGGRRVAFYKLTEHGRKFGAVGRLMRHHKEAGHDQATLTAFEVSTRGPGPTGQAGG